MLNEPISQESELYLRACLAGMGLPEAHLQLLVLLQPRHASCLSFSQRLYFFGSYQLTRLLKKLRYGSRPYLSCYDCDEFIARTAGALGLGVINYPCFHRLKAELLQV